MQSYFMYNARLGIELPSLTLEWEDYDKQTQQAILLHWEKIRGRIPDRIVDLEDFINEKQARLEEEMDFKKSCQLNSEIAELASVINDLWIWYRTNQDVTTKIHS
ncbi:hypothetical protein ACFOU2_06740 [Bacillus songklensis]|uniref:Radical SAM protein n=1 Tax=Bacillus songklensis TaxID=1069116 RepID=A0ABV8B205_9BACI